MDRHPVKSSKLGLWGGGALTQWNADTKDKMYRKEKGPKKHGDLLDNRGFNTQR